MSIPTSLGIGDRVRALGLIYTVLDIRWADHQNKINIKLNPEVEALEPLWISGAQMESLMKAEVINVVK